MEAIDDGSEEFYARRFPQLTVEVLCETESRPWDVIIVDEAQDLLTTDHLDVLDLLVDSGLRQGTWHLFIDPQQNIYGVEEEKAVEERLKQCGPAFEDLFENCRNTREIAVEASIISGIDLAIEGAPSGLPAQVHHYSEDAEGRAILESLLGDLLERDVKATEIAILSTRRHENSLLSKCHNIAGRSLVSPGSEDELVRGALLFSTMHAFKGLDRQVVIALDMGEIGDERWRMLHYAGLSRARALLHVLLPSSATYQYAEQAKEYGRRISQGVAR